MKKSDAKALLEDFAKYMGRDGSTVVYKQDVDNYLELLESEVDLRRPRGYSKACMENAK